MINTIQTLKIGGEKTEMEYEVQLVHMDDLISCINSGGGAGGGALSVKSICGQVM